MDSHSIGTPPRSTLLALWLALGDRARELPLGVTAIQRDDEPHRVEGIDGVDGVEALLHRHAGRTAAAVALLPMPGDILGVPAAVSREAAAAGECVLLTAADGAHLAIVPEVTRFGSSVEPGHTVTWQATTIGPWLTGVWAALGSLRDADSALRVSLRVATDALAALDVAKWRDDAAGAIAGLRATTLSRNTVPAGIDAQAMRVLAQAVRLRAIVGLARADDGAAVNLWQADQRGAALQEVDHAARRAICAATLPPAGT